MLISNEDYETLRTHVAEQFAWLEAWATEHNHPHAKTHILKLHSYAQYAGNSEDEQREIVRPLDGTPKPDPHGP